MMSKNLVLSLVSVTVLPELLGLIKSRPVKWWSLDLVLEVWPSTWKLIMSVLSSSVTIDKFNKEIPLLELVQSLMSPSEKRC